MYNYEDYETEPVYDETVYRKIDREKKKRKKKNYLLRFLIVVLVAGGAFASTFSSLFLIENVTADGNAYYSDEEIMHMAGVDKGINLIWDVDKSDCVNALMESPYFAEVKVRRKLPKTLHFEITERKQIAAVVYGENYIVIDKEGTVLRKSDLDPKVTLLTGLTVSKLSTGNRIEAEEEVILETTLNMLDTMENGDIYFKKIDVSRVIIKAYIYDTLIVKGTPKQMTKAIESGDLQKVVNNLLKNDTTRGTISLGNQNYMSFSPVF